MSKYESSRELARKADYEGGLDGMVFGYGLAVADLPDDMPVEIVEAIQRLLAVTGDYEKADAYLNDRLDEDGGDDW